MKVVLDGLENNPMDEPRIGNVYAIRGGRGSRYKHMNVIIAITTPKDCYQGRSVLMLTIDKDGDPVGVTHYALHYVQDLAPVAFVNGLEDITLIMRSL